VIDAAVFSVSPGPRRRIGAWQCEENCSPDDIEYVGGRFLEFANGLGRSVGEAGNVTVEFLLPWSLLGHPVERWSLDTDGYWIGRRFPVVVRSLDRQRKESFYRLWRDRWDLLSQENTSRSASERIGWLHHGGGAVPDHASGAGRVIQLTEGHELTQWLEKDENCDTVALGLTFTYVPEDSVSVNGVKAAIHEGIPLLVWLRGEGDINQLERLLEEADIRDLPRRVFKWRRQTAAATTSTRDARYHIVLLWDNPADTCPPAERFFAAPR
jgi:hypothetical protein